VSLFFLLHLDYLLLSLLVLEIKTFLILFFISVSTSSASCDLLILSFFSVFVMEGVLALRGLIALVRFSGSDYIRSSSITKC